MLDEQTPAEAGTETTTPDTTSGASASGESGTTPAKKAPAKRAPRKTAAKKTAAAAESPGDAPGPDGAPEDGAAPPAKKAPAKRAAAKRAPAKKAAPAPEPAAEPDQPDAVGQVAAEGDAAPPAKKTTARKTTRARKTTSPAVAPGEVPAEAPVADSDAAPAAVEAPVEAPVAGTRRAKAKTAPAITPLFQAPETPARPARKTTAKKTAKKAAPVDAELPLDEEETPLDEALTAEGVTETPGDETETAATADGTVTETDDTEDADEGDDESAEGAARRRRRRGGRRRRKPAGEGGQGQGPDGGTASDGSEGGGSSEQAAEAGESAETREESDAEGAEAGEQGEGGTTRRRRRRRRAGEGGGDDESTDDPQNTVTRVRTPRSAEDQITGFSGSTRLEAKKQRRREGREAGRRRAPIISEAEFLARRESVDRTMVIRQRGDLTQIAVLEDKVLVEHYVARESQTSLIGNVYLGRVQNVLPSMEAAFIDIGKGRNAVLYAGEVNWESFGARDGNQRKIEQVLKPGQAVLVQVSKDPIGHKGARLTSQISLPGRFLVYVPDGTTSGISRKLPENERGRLKTLLKEIVPDTAGVIVRTAAEGASEDELTRDVERLKARWEDISGKVASGNAPQLLYGEPDLTVKVVRDLFTEDFAKLVISGEDAWETVKEYVEHVAPDLADRLERHDDEGADAFAAYRIDEQIAKGLDRKVWLPSGGSLIIDRTEAMTVVDVNTGKFTGSGGNLEETVTKNNLEAAEEIVRQLRLRDIGGIIVVDFIDMVLESNRDLVLRRLIECLGRDRTRHQVAEVTSLGLVQMTRKRIGTGLLEAFSENCDHCQGRGLVVHHEPVEQRKQQQRQPADEEPRRSNRRNRGRGKGDEQQGGANGDRSAAAPATAGGAGRRPTPADFAAMARAEAHAAEQAERDAADGSGAGADVTADVTELEPVEQAVVAASAAEPLSEWPHGEPAVTVDVPEDDLPLVDAAAAAAPEEPSADTADLPGEEPAPEPEPTPEPEAEAEPEIEPAPPAAPRIVTTTRRAGARRAAGRPSGAPVGGTTTGGTATATLDGPAPGDVATAPESGTETGTETGLETGAGVPEDGGTAAHVPIKKKGSRKR